MIKEDPHSYCFMIRKGKPCIKIIISKEHLPYYECNKCIWRIKSKDPRHLKSLDKIYETYRNKS